jgi:hypothetical protein
MKIARCKVCSKIEAKYKLLVPRLDSFIKHSNLRKCDIAKLGVIVGMYYVKPHYVHVKNDIVY